MSFPTSPTDGDIHQQYVYNGTVGVWDKMDPSKYYPIGFMYVQYPGKSDPSTLGWYGTWTNVSSTYAGDFFRAEGGDASAFESGEQLDQMQRITGKSSVVGMKTSEGSWGVDENEGAIGLGESVTNLFSDGLEDTRRIEFDSTNSPDARTSSTTDGETRPVNQTIRIWERTA